MDNLFPSFFFFSYFLFGQQEPVSRASNVATILLYYYELRVHNIFHYVIIIVYVLKKGKTRKKLCHFSEFYSSAFSLCGVQGTKLRIEIKIIA